MLILISGLPGSGKSTLARHYVARYGGAHVNSDLLRGELGLRGKYGQADKEQVYAAMLEKVRAILQKGGTAVVDSTFYRQSIRAPFEALAAALQVPVFCIEVKASEATIRERLRRPRPDSEADFDVYLKIRERYEPWSEPCLVLWSDRAPMERLLETLHLYTHPNHEHPADPSTT
ncbi:MAG: ATP-binding protein [Bacteroidetes bacterium]|nr:MAG: ATP-binding protein [Bacteroidota bacterium]